MQCLRIGTTHTPPFNYWSTYCVAFKDVAIISPNLAKIDKIVDFISIDTAPPATTLVVVRPPPMIKKHGPNTQKRIPNSVDMSTDTSTNKRKYTKAKNEPTRVGCARTGQAQEDYGGQAIEQIRG